MYLTRNFRNKLRQGGKKSRVVRRKSRSGRKSRKSRSNRKLRRSRRNRRKLKLVRSGGVSDKPVSSTRDYGMDLGEVVMEARQWKQQNETANREAEAKALEDRWAANSPEYNHKLMVKLANQPGIEARAKRDEEGEDTKTNPPTWKQQFAQRLKGDEADWKTRTEVSGAAAARGEVGVADAAERLRELTRTGQVVGLR